jgi:hypothetical protein
VKLQRATSTEQDNDDIVLWHMWLGHLVECNIFKLHKRNLLKCVKSCKLNFCKYYMYMKQQRVSSKVASHTHKNVLNYIHLNVWDQS